MGNLTRLPALLWSVAVVAALVIGCQSPTGPYFVEELGFIEWDNEPFEVLVLPPAAPAGTDFTVSVRTFGDGCSTRARTDVRYEGRVAIITPYDNHVAWMPPNMGCPRIIARPDHTVILRFATPGVAQVRVEGRRYPSLEPTVLTGTLTIE